MSGLPTHLAHLSSFRAQNPHIEPLWIGNQLANDSLHRRSGVIAWPGSNVPINGHFPYRRLAFDFNRTCRTVMQQACEWFREPVETRINFGAIYCFEPDRTGNIRIDALIHLL